MYAKHHLLYWRSGCSTHQRKYLHITIKLIEFLLIFGELWREFTWWSIAIFKFTFATRFSIQLKQCTQKRKKGVRVNKAYDEKR